MRSAVKAMVGLAILIGTEIGFGTALSAAPQASLAGVPAIVEQRSRDVFETLQGRGTYEQVFAPAFRQAIPAEQIAQVAAQLSATLGTPRAVRSVTPQGASAAVVEIAFERGTASFEMTLDSAAPYWITGLRVTGTALSTDTPDAVAQAFRALPGSAGFGVYTLEGNGPVLISGYRDSVPAPIASTFKLWVLSALSKSVGRHERRWEDVILLGKPVMGSQVSGRWPTGSPLTLHSLATMMISVSDNRAADTLMTALGRPEVDAAASASGAIVPVLTTRETTALKNDPVLAHRWGAASEQVRRQMLDLEMAELLARTPEGVAGASGGPVSVEEVEWFASPLQVARTMDAFRSADAGTARSILAVNAGAAPATAGRFRYLGYKGGSEPGVISLAYLVGTNDGRWLAIVGNWHDRSAVDEVRFAGLMDRLLTQAAAAGRAHGGAGGQ